MTSILPCAQTVLDMVNSFINVYIERKFNQRIIGTFVLVLMEKQTLKHKPVLDGIC